MKKILLFTAVILLLSQIWQGAAQVTNFPWTEDFESSSDLPNGWTKIVYDTSNDVEISTDENHTPGGSQSVRFSSYDQSSDYNQYLFSEQIHVTAPYTELHFWHKKYDSSDETLEWAISAAPAVDSVHTWTAVLLDTDWQEEIIDLSAYVGRDIYIAWHYYGDYLYYVYLDDVSIQEPSSCPQPTSLSVIPVSSSAASVDWQGNGANQWVLEYGSSGFSPGSGTRITGLTSPHYDITGLSGASSYEVYVWADCGNDSSRVVSKTWVQPVSDNQTCRYAIQLSVGSNDLSTAMVTDNTAATDSGIEDPQCGEYAGGDLWFKTAVPGSGRVAFLTLPDNNDFDSAMAVYEGSCDTLSLAQCDDDDGYDLFSKIEYTGTPGDTVYVRVWSFDNEDQDTFKVVALEPPANDNCETATEVASLPFTQNEFALGNFRTPLVNDSIVNGLWYKFTVDQANDSITITVIPDTDTNTKIFLFSGNCGNLTPLIEDNRGDFGESDAIVFMPANHTTYYINVADGYPYDPINTYQIQISGNSTLRSVSFKDLNFDFHPNPTNGIIRWNATKTVEHIQITNLAGQVLLNTEQPAGNTLDISRLPQGVYLLHVRMDGKEGVYRIIKE